MRKLEYAEVKDTCPIEILKGKILEIKKFGNRNETLMCAFVGTDRLYEIHKGHLKLLTAQEAGVCE